MSEYRYLLERGSKKHNCPRCNEKRFVRYFDTTTNENLPELYGRCDREANCSYHLNPYLDGYAKMIEQKELGKYSENWTPSKPQPFKKPLSNKTLSFIPFEILKHTLSGYEKNTFIQNLLTKVAFPFKVEDVEEVISLYHLGTIQNGYRSRAITFPFIDENSNIRTIQVKNFDENNHTVGTDFLHSIIEKNYNQINKSLPKWLEDYKTNEIKVSCLFGVNILVKYSSNPIALVEAPKTAIYGTLYFGHPNKPKNFVWLAVYNLSSLNLAKCKALEGRDVYLFPDLSKDSKAFNLWTEKAQYIEGQLENTTMVVSDLLEQLSGEKDKAKGADLADYIIEQDWRDYRPKNTSQLSQPINKIDNLNTNRIPNVEILKIEDATIEVIEDWTYEIQEIESVLREITIPTEPISLNNWSIIKDVSQFIETHLAVVINYNGQRRFKPYLNRLQELTTILYKTKCSLGI